MQAGLLAAQVYPKLFVNGSSMYETAWWGWLVTVWEAIVYNPLIDLGACYQASHPRLRARPVWHHKALVSNLLVKLPSRDARSSGSSWHRDS